MTSRRSPELKPTPWDALVVAAVIALGVAVALLFYGGIGHDGALRCTVSVGGELTDTLPMEEAVRSYQHNGYTLQVEITPDGVRVAESDCPSQDCLHTGTITRAGQSIVCLPAQIVIHLEGAAADGPDVIVG